MTDSAQTAPITNVVLDNTWLRKVIYNFTNVDPGSPPLGVSLNDIYLKFGIQPVVFANNKARPFYVADSSFKFGGQTINDTEQTITQTPFSQYDGGTTYSAGTDTLLFSLPASATKIYVTGILTSGAAAGDNQQFKNGSGGTTVVGWTSSTQQNQSFTIPLVFTNSIYINTSTGGKEYCTIMGWYQ